MRKVDCYYYDGESDCCGALSDYSKGLAGKEPCIDEKCKMREPTQAFECTAENCPLEFGKVGKCTVHNCEYRTKPQTNFDKITQSVESFVEFIYSQYGGMPPDVPCPMEENASCKEMNCKKCFTKWLQKECEE